MPCRLHRIPRSPGLQSPGLRTREPRPRAPVSTGKNLVSQFYKAGLIPNNVDMAGYITTEFNSSVSG